MWWILEDLLILNFHATVFCIHMIHVTLQEERSGMNLETIEITGGNIREELNPNEKDGRKKESTTDELKKEIKMVILK